MALDAYLERYRQIGGTAPFAALGVVDSTNRVARDVARSYLEEGRRPPTLVVAALEQTAGRGRRGRSWVSPAGQGVYTSLLLSVADAEQLGALPLSVPLALAEALEPVLGARCGIKWPNDLVVEGSKLGGVLIEAVAGPRAVIVGYGVNACQRRDELPTSTATSIRVVSGATPDPARLTAELAVSVLGRLATPGELAAIVAAYRERSIHRAGDELHCRLGEAETTGFFRGFDDRGRLRLDTAGGERLVSGGEILTEGAAQEPSGGGSPDSGGSLR